MKKRIFALLVAMLSVIMLTVGVAAEDEYYRLQDLTEVPLLTESENAEILALLDEVSERQGMDIAILTVDAVEEGLTVEEVIKICNSNAASFFDFNNHLN